MELSKEQMEKVIYELESNYNSKIFDDENLIIIINFYSTRSSICYILSIRIYHIMLQHNSGLILNQFIIIHHNFNHFKHIQILLFL